MRYIDWVETVFAKLAEAARSRSGWDGMGVMDLRELAPGDIYEDNEAGAAAVQATQDLGVLIEHERGENRLSALGREVAAHPLGLRATWARIAEGHVDDDERAFLEVA